MKLFCGILIGLITFSSCHSDDSSNTNDIIIGQWKIYKQFESNVEVEVDPCDVFWIIEYNANKSADSFNFDPYNYPTTCPVTISEAGWNWVNRGNGTYEIRYLEEEGTYYLFYKDGERLVRESSDGITKVIYDTYK